MRKEFMEVLDKYVVNTNKSIFDLDISYLEKNGCPNIRDIKSREMGKVLEDSFYVYNECLRTSPEAKPRFVVSYVIMKTRGNLTEFKIVDNKTGKEYIDHFEFYPLLGKKGYYMPHDMTTWLNNTLVELNRS